MAQLVFRVPPIDLGKRSRNGNTFSLYSTFDEGPWRSNIILQSYACIHKCTIYGFLLLFNSSPTPPQLHCEIQVL